MLGHWPDRFNHTCEDSIDKVDPEELRRSATIAGAAAYFLAIAAKDEMAKLEGLVAQWGTRRMTELAATALEAQPARRGWIDPRSARELPGWLRHIATTAQAAARATSALNGGASRWSEWLQRQAREHAAFLSVDAEEPKIVGQALRRAWTGPFNLRGMLEGAPQADVDRLSSELASDKGLYGLYLALALAIDGRTDRNGVIRRAAYSSGLAVNEEKAHLYLDMMKRAGWVEEAVA